MGQVVSLARERELRTEVARMIERSIAQENPEMRCLIVALGTDGNRYLMPTCDDFCEYYATMLVGHLRRLARERPNPQVKDYFSFGYMPGERAKLLEEQCIIEAVGM
jgi:hypothetical protein